MKLKVKLKGFIIMFSVLFATVFTISVFAAQAPIIVTNSHKIDRTKSSPSQRYANALTLSLSDVSNYISYDSGVVKNGNTFVNTLTTPGGASNRYVRIGLNNNAGIFDLTELNGSAGQVGIHVDATVNVSNTTNGMYVYLKDDMNDSESYVTHRHHIDWQKHSILNKIFELETTLWNVNQAYIEILLPYNAQITINNIYLFVEKEVPGFGDMHTRIIGGTNAQPQNIHTVQNAAQLTTALNTVKNSGAPSIIRVNGTIKLSDWNNAGNSGKYISLVTDNISIVGVDNNGKIEGLGIKVDGHNTIIENLTFTGGQAIDAVQVNGGTDTWIRHNTFIDGGRNLPEGSRYDELTSIKNESQYVIMSWNHFKNSNRVLLVGSNDGIDALPDRRVILHHNFFETVTQRVPLFRGGHAHIYNNYFKDIDFYGVGVRKNSKLKIENNYFENVKNPIYPPNEDPGRYQISGNMYVNSTGSQPTSSTISNINFKDYSYSLDPTASVPSIVMNGAGAGKIGGGGGGNDDLHQVIEAEDYDSMSGVQKEASSEGGQNIGYIHDGDWIRFDNFRFGSNGPTRLDLRVATVHSNTVVEVRLGGVSGTLVGSCPIASTGGWQTWQTQSCFVTAPTGTHNLYFVFTGPSGYLFNFNWFKFTDASYVKIQNVGTGLYLDGMGRTSNGDDVGQWSNSSSSNQRWAVEKSGNNVKIKNVATNLYLDGMGRTTNGENAGQYSGNSSLNQQWSLESVGVNWKLKNIGAGLYLDGMGRTTNGEAAGQWSSSNSNNQRWKIVPF